MLEPALGTSVWRALASELVGMRGDAAGGLTAVEGRPWDPAGPGVQLPLIRSSTVWLPWERH